MIAALDVERTRAEQHGPTLNPFGSYIVPVDMGKREGQRDDKPIPKGLSISSSHGGLPLTSKPSGLLEW